MTTLLFTATFGAGAIVGLIGGVMISGLLSYLYNERRPRRK